jgi:PAT family beta-lactamase induction signal transducer AmpG
LLTDTNPIIQQSINPKTRPWFWIPTLYLAEGFPNAIVTTIAIVLYKATGISNTQIAFYTGLFYLPWVIKPLWGPVVDILSTRRSWIWSTQLVLGGCLAVLALCLPTPYFFPASLVTFWLLAFTSATHDIAADGFYMLALSEQQQSFFVGVRNMVYRVANLLVKSPLILLAVALGRWTNDVQTGWAIAFGAMAILFAMFGTYHGLVLPRPTADRWGNAESLPQFFREFYKTFGAFVSKPKLGRMLLFLLFYRFGEAQLLPLVQPFLLDPHDAGGLGLTQQQFGIVYGTIGVSALILGGIIGGILVSRFGLQRCLWPMVCVMHLPDAVFIYLSSAQPENLKLISACIAVEQFGYGFGFTAYMLYMIYIARGEHQTAHYAICAGLMALGLMVPGMWSGWLQDHLGYHRFFIWVVLATIPGFIVTALIPLDREFGRKR